MVDWHSSVPSRSCVNKPISLASLLTLIHRLNVELFNGARSVYRSKVDCTIEVITSTVVSQEIDSCESFFASGGVLISTALAVNWHNRSGFMFDDRFWRLWDVLVMRSGWVTLDLSTFCSIYNIGCCGDFLPLIPTLEPLSSLGLSVDPLSSIIVGFSLFRDLLDLFKYFVSHNRWGFGNRSVSYLEYQIKLLDLMITRLSPPNDLLHVILDLNEWGVCVSSSFAYTVPCHVEESRAVLYVMILVLRYSLVFSVTADYCPNIIKYCNISQL
jgi:hypothetical protein